MQKLRDRAREQIHARRRGVHKIGEERILGEAVQASRQVAVLEEDSYRIGKSDLRAVSQRYLATWAAEVALLAVRRERLSRRVDLHLALGGNFGEPQPVASAEPSNPPATN